MLNFLVIQDGLAAESCDIRSAYLMDGDEVPILATIEFAAGQIICEKREHGACCLSLQYNVPEAGLLILQTCLLPERLEPYLLSLELARHRLMKIITKMEDWAMFDPSAATTPAFKKHQQARDLFIEALNHSHDPAACDRLANQALSLAIAASEDLTLRHADQLYERRGKLPNSLRAYLGCGLSGPNIDDRVLAAAHATFKFISVPMPWAKLEPREQEFNSSSTDLLVEWAFRSKIPVFAGPLASLEAQHIPPWLYVWEHDYEMVRDLMHEHIQRVITRYKTVVPLWNVASGFHSGGMFNFDQDQLIDLTRVVVNLVRRLHPGGLVVVEIAHPFGEYGAHKQNSIPPLRYLDLLLQSGIHCDAFGLRLLMGQPKPGQASRDLMQISNLLDRFNGITKPLHITAIGVPSEPIAAPAGSRQPPSGFWRGPWSPALQASWLESVYRIALSKSFVESISWLDATDMEESEMPNVGLVRKNLQSKPSFKVLANICKSIHEMESAHAGEEHAPS